MALLFGAVCLLLRWRSPLLPPPSPRRGSRPAFDKRLPNSKPELREVFAKLQAKHGTVLMFVDQSASIGALPIAVARHLGFQVAYLPGLTTRRIADLCPGGRRGQDRRPRRLRHRRCRPVHAYTLRSIELEDETVAELEVIVGFDDDLAGEATRISTRLRGMLTQIHPHFERVLGPRIHHPAVLRLLNQFGSPALIRTAGRRRLVNLIGPKAPHMADRLVGLLRARRTDRRRPRHGRGRPDRLRSRQLAPSRP
ncbi:IS110 family transposase [Streptomyces sp. 8N114]|uniref:IS110 family transposase n=1 Tax=Streptomyces sp. 8N114 TaxID=3457419 RepID=UPI003FD46957